MSRNPVPASPDGSELPDSSPPEGNLQEAIGLPRGTAIDRVTPATLVAIEKAGYSNLEPAGTGEEGATGAVFKAREVHTQRRVALKVIVDPTSKRSQNQLQRERSVLCAERLPSSVVHYLGCLDERSHQPVLVLEYIDGEKIHKHARRDQCTMADRIELCRHLFEELGRLHEAGILYGDLSPNNVLVDVEGRIRFVDFGQARRIDPGYRSLHSLSGPGGTPGIASTAVLKGERRPEPRDDVRAAAATAFLVLTGRRVDHDRDGKPRRGSTATDWLRDLRDAGVPPALAKLVGNTLRDAEAPRSQDARPRPHPQARAVAERIGRWVEGRRRLRQRLQLLAAVLLVAVPLAWAALVGWQRYRAEQAAAVQRSVEALDREIALRPNLVHPAVKEVLAGAHKARTAWQDGIARGDAASTEQSLHQLLTALREVLTTSHEVEAVEPLRSSLGVVLARTPWTVTCPTIKQRQAELSQRFLGLGETLDGGNWRTAWAGLRKLQAELALLAEDNVAAGRTEQARGDYRRLEHGVSARLRSLPAWPAKAARAEEAERLLQAGQFDDTTGPGALTEYGQAKAQLEAFLAENETPDESRARLTVDVNTVAELERRIASLQAEVAEANGRIGTLQQQLTVTAAERDTMQGVREMLQKLVTSTEQQRDAAEKARATLAAELEVANQARATAEAEFERLRSNLAAGLEPTRKEPVVAAERDGTNPRVVKKQTTGIGLTMRWVADGTFQMGSPGGEEGRNRNERLHRVTLSRGYWLGETEVTQKQWFTVMGTRPWQRRSNVLEGDGVAASYISWNDAAEFCRKLTERERSAGRLPTGFEYRLPTEAEWEYAARAGTTTKFCFGDDAGRLFQFAVFEYSRDGQTAQQVRSRLPNQWGFHDLYGNVWEWCADEVAWSKGVVSDTYQDGVVDPRGTGGSMRAVRGGCWRYSAVNCRSANRHACGPDLAYDDLGFRPALAPRSDAR